MAWDEYPISILITNTILLLILTLNITMHTYGIHIYILFDLLWSIYDTHMVSIYIYIRHIYRSGIHTWYAHIYIYIVWSIVEHLWYTYGIYIYTPIYLHLYMHLYVYIYTYDLWYTYVYIYTPVCTFFPSHGTLRRRRF